VLVPVARDGRRIVGIDRSAPMLDRARAKLARARARPGAGAPDLRATLLRGDIRDLPWRAGTFGLVMAPYGILQSLTREADLRRTLAAVHRVLRPGALFGIDLVPTCRAGTNTNAG
jgi:ubiquinone/menaquinone biosynthesis C-methylase UbiE